MIIDSKKYNGACECGHNHEMSTQFCIIERGCMKNIAAYIESYGLSGTSVAIYDENTYNAEGLIRPRGDFEIILPKENLHADDRGVELLKARLPEKCDYMIAIGSGTIHDITRYCAYEREIPFVSCPTAASVDGFCSSVAAMTWHGFKKTLTAVAPKIVVADLDIISKAPIFLAKSGFGDMIGKFIALFEWKMSRFLVGEYFCSKIYNMTLEATKEVVNCAEAIKNGDPAAYEKLVYGLLISGLAMQMLGNSRCASGAEHHISHIIEMEPMGLSVKSSALHGEKVGVGTLLAVNEYKRLAKNGLKAKDYPEIEDEYIYKMFGERLSESIISENKNDAAKNIKAQLINENAKKIEGLIAEIPDFEELLSLYGKLDLKATLSDIGVSEDKLDAILEYSPLVRNRLTLMRLRRALK